MHDFQENNSAAYIRLRKIESWFPEGTRLIMHSDPLVRVLAFPSPGTMFRRKDVDTANSIYFRLAKSEDMLSLWRSGHSC
eukprot:3633552-Amphidinium_carterae.1